MPRNQVSRLQRPTHRTALPGDLAASVILNSFVAPPTCTFLHLQLLQATESTRLTSAGSTPVPTRTASAVQPTSRTALRATSRTGVLPTLTPVPASVAPGAVPSGYGLNSTDPTRIYPCVDAHCTTCAANASNTRLQVGGRIPARPVHRDSILPFQPESQQGCGANSSDNTRVYPCSEAYCIACSANASNCSVCGLRSQWIPLDPLPSAIQSCVRVTPRHSSRSGYGPTQLIIRKFILCSDATASLMLCQPLNCSACNTREWLPLHPFTDPPSCVTPATVPSKYRSERHRLLQSVPVPRNQVSRLVRPTHRTALPAISPHRSSSTRSLHLRPAFLHLQLLQATGVNSADLPAGSTPLYRLELHQLCSQHLELLCVQPRERSPAQLLRQRACLVSLQVQSPSGYGLNSTDPARIYPLRGCSLHNLLPTPRTARPAKLADGYLLDPYTAIPSCVLSAGIPAGYGPTRATTPECTHAQKPTALHAAPTPRTVLLATSQPTDTYLNPFATPPTCVKTPNFPSGLGIKSTDYTKALPLQRRHCQSHALCQLLELLCLQHREWLPLHPFTDPPSCVTPATVPSSSTPTPPGVYPCLETKCLACKANASNCFACDLAASVILNSFVAPPTCVPPSPAPPGYGVNSADLSRF